MTPIQVENPKESTKTTVTNNYEILRFTVKRQYQDVDSLQNLYSFNTIPIKIQQAYFLLKN